LQKTKLRIKGNPSSLVLDMEPVFQGLLGDELFLSRKWHTCGDVDGLILGDVSDDQLVPAGVLLYHAELNFTIEQERDLGAPGVGLQSVRTVVSKVGQSTQCS